MTQNEMISNIAGKCNVTPEEARAALEAGEWNALTAAQLLENEKLRRMQEVEEVASGCATATAGWSCRRTRTASISTSAT